MCSKLQVNHNFFQHNYKIPKECKQNIDMKISQTCLNDSEHMCYTDQMMIDDWFKISHLYNDDKLLHCWFDDNICTFFSNVESAEEAHLPLISMPTSFQKNLSNIRIHYYL